MNKLFTLTYHKDSFNIVNGVELSTSLVDNHTFQSPMTYLKSIGPRNNKSCFRTGAEALQEITDNIIKPPTDFEEEGRTALIAFANKIAVDNPEWLI